MLNLRKDYFISYIIKAYLSRTEIKQYMAGIFGPIFNKLYDFNGLSINIRNNLLKNLLSKEVDLSYNQVIDPLLKLPNKEVIEPLKAYELMAFSEALFKNIIESLAFIPCSIRYLLKTIEQCVIEKVLIHISIRFLMAKLRASKLSLTSYSIIGGFQCYQKLKRMEY